LRPGTRLGTARPGGAKGWKGVVQGLGPAKRIVLKNP